MHDKIFKRYNVTVFFLTCGRVIKKSESVGKHPSILFSGTAKDVLGIKLQEVLKQLMLLHQIQVFLILVIWI